MLLISFWYGILFFIAKDLDSFHIQYAMGMFVLSLYLAIFFYRKINPILGISYLYFALNSIRLFTFPRLYFRQFELEAIIGFESLVTAAFLYLTIISVVFALLRDEEKKYLKYLFTMFAIINSIFYVIRLFWEDKDYFMFNNSSIDAAFLGCLLPLIWEYLHSKFSKAIAISFFILLASPCLFSQTSAGILGIGLSMSAYFWAKNKFQIKYFIVGCYMAGTIATIGYLTQGEMLMHSSGRTHIWKLAMTYWMENVNKAWGSGMGTYQMIGPGLQIAESIVTHTEKQPIAGFFWAHSEIIQPLFETGIIGLLFVLLISITTLLKLRKNPAMFAGFATFIATATFEMHLRHIVFTCLGGLFIIYAFKPPIRNIDPLISHP